MYSDSSLPVKFVELAEAEYRMLCEEFDGVMPLDTASTLTTTYIDTNTIYICTDTGNMYLGKNKIGGSKCTVNPIQQPYTYINVTFGADDNGPDAKAFNSVTTPDLMVYNHFYGDGYLRTYSITLNNIPYTIASHIADVEIFDKNNNSLHHTTYELMKSYYTEYANLTIEIPPLAVDYIEVYVYICGGGV